MSKITGSGILLLTYINQELCIILYRDTTNNKYEDLGGRIDEGEDIFQTASRETYEESATYINYEPSELYTSKKIILKNYVSFIKIIKNFNISKAMTLLEKYKYKKHYNEMDDIKIVPLNILIKSILKSKPILQLRSRVIEIIYKLYRIPANNI